MTVALSDLRTEIQQRLGDSGAAIWSTDELDSYITDGYNQLTIETGCLWETACLPDYAFSFNYTQDFELDFAEAQGGWLISGKAQFTCLDERDFADNADGPANHTEPWEFNNGYVVSTTVAAVADVPGNLLAVERATWNSKKITPLRSRDLEADDARYEVNAGEVLSYVMDKDGLRRLRKWRVPSAPYIPFSKTTASSEYGTLRSAADISTEPVQGIWGTLRRIPGQHPIGGPWGTVRTVYKEQNSVRLEYQRRGNELGALQDFEIPDRYTKYIRNFAMWKALLRDGKGQDLQLAEHYHQRYMAGLARTVQRKQAVQFQKSYRLGGGSSTRGTAPPRARLPWQYGKVVR